MSPALLLLATTVLSADLAQDMPIEAPATPARVRQAVVGSLGYLTDEGLKWMREKQCASCHHVPQMLWALNEVRDHGFAIDEAALAEVSGWALATDNRAKIIADGPPEGIAAGHTLAAVYVTLGAGRDRQPDAAQREGLARLTALVVSKQQPDGSWPGVDGRPPLLDVAEVVAALSVLALASPALQEDPSQFALAESRGKAIAWLESTTPGDSHQSQVLRLLVQMRLGKSPDEVRPMVDAILARQQADGGWRQAADLPTDALATGQALYVMRLAGKSADDPAVQRGVAWLVNTQSADGSWPMHSRPNPINGSKGSNLAPITYAGTAWAVIGLAGVASP